MKRIVVCCLVLLFAVFLSLNQSSMAASSNDPVEAARQKMLEDDRKKAEEKLRERFKKILPISDLTKKAGFIAVSDYPMDHEEAVAFCKHYGGKLPRVNKSSKWIGYSTIRGVPIDGFGYGDRPWDEVGLPDRKYWTDTDGGGPYPINVEMKYKKVGVGLLGIGGGGAFAGCVKK